MQREEKTKEGENIFINALSNRFWLTSKGFSWFNKVIYGQISSKWNSRKGKGMLLKVDNMYSLLRKST